MASSGPRPLPSRLVPASVMRMMVPRNVKAKSASGEAKLTENGGGARSEVEVIVDMETKALLGIDVDWADGKTLYIKSVHAGAIEDWNKDHADQLPIRVGDRIFSVNGLEGDAEAMVRECRQRKQLRLLVRQAVPVLKSPRPPPVAATPRPPIVDLDGLEESAGKKPRTGGDDSLYSGMPAPDPEKDRSAVTRAKEQDIFSEAPAPENPRLVAFLDIDGVLRRLEGLPTINVDGELLPVQVGGRAFVPEAVRALRFLVHRTGCGVVLSSEWRRNPELREEVATAIRALGLPPMRGQTALLQAREELLVGSPANPDREGTLRLRWAERRSREITLWLREHPEVQHWVALDDLDLSIADDSKIRAIETLRMGPCLVQCDPEVGFTLSRARAAVDLLLRS